MHADLLIRNIGQLATCASEGAKKGRAMSDAGFIEEAAIAIVDGKVAAVGDSEAICRDLSAAEEIDASGCAVVPGFVDCHTHIVYAGDRLNEFEMKIEGAAYLDILAAGGGILSTVEATRSASEGELVRGGLNRLNKMFQCGTTTAEIKTGYGLETGAELKMLAAIAEIDRLHLIDVVPTFLGAHTLPPELRDDPDVYVDVLCDEMMPKVWSWYEVSHFEPAGVRMFADVFCENKAFSRDQTETILRTAKALWFGLKAHADQFTNLGASRLAIELGAASIDHLDSISAEEVRMLADSDTIGVVIPTENFSGGKTIFADARKMIDAGCAIAVSTDYNPGSAPCPSLPMAMAIACRYQKLLPAEALNAVTINAAHAIGMGERKGSIEVGKDADLLLLDGTDYRQLAYEFGGSCINKIVKAGHVITLGPERPI